MNLEQLLFKSLVDTLYLTGMMILFGFILGFWRTKTLQNFRDSFGEKALYITGLGIVVHEISHAVFALIFHHKVTEIKFIQKKDENGTLGYVNHTYNPISLYQQIGNFFIGIAPILGGITVMIVLMKIMLPDTYKRFIVISINNLNVTTLNKTTLIEIISSYSELIKTIFSVKNFSNPYFILFIFLGISVSCHISLSTADIKGCFHGWIIIYILILIINVLGISKYVFALNILKYNILIVDFLIISVFFSVTAYLISLLLVLIKKRKA